MAVGNTGKVQTFSHLLWPGLQIWNRDLDALAPAIVVADLARVTGTSNTQAEATSFRGLNGILYENVRNNGTSKWVLPLGIYHRTRRLYGQQWCPHCLADDSQPYYRLDWRLAISSSCSRHGAILLDRCPECQSSVVPHRGDDPFCHVCKLDRRTVSTVIADSLVLQLEHRLRKVAFARAAPPGVFLELHPLAYFGLVRQVLGIVTSNPRAQRLRDQVCRATGRDPLPPLFLTKSRTPEALSTADRHRMMSITASLMQRWPFSFVGPCAEAGMWRTWAIRGDQTRLPYVYDQAVTTYLSAGQA